MDFLKLKKAIETRSHTDSLWLESQHITHKSALDFFRLNLSQF